MTTRPHLVMIFIETKVDADNPGAAASLVEAAVKTAASIAPALSELSFKTQAYELPTPSKHAH